MTTMYLTERDEQNFGSALLDVTQRAALQAVTPHLQNLEQQNTELRQRLARESRHRLDQQVAAAIPNYREVDRDPRWHRWLLGIDTMSGRVRQTLLNEAIASGNAARVKAFFNGFQNEAGAAQAPSRGSSRASGQARASGKPSYTRAQITELYDLHRKGHWSGREAEWALQEEDIIAAAREGRVLGPPYLTK